MKQNGDIMLGEWPIHVMLPTHSETLYQESVLIQP